MRIIIAGGGTGGHLFPGIAIAEAFYAKSPKCKILFIGTDRPFETTILAEKEFDHDTIFVQAIKGKRIWNKLGTVATFPWSIYQAIKKIRRFGANLVVGVGGYSAAPVAVGAWLMGIRVVIHEQNMLPGITNRLLSKLASRIYISFKHTRMPGDPKKIRALGNPVRQEVAAIRERSTAKGHQPDSRFTVLVLGGSQGAHSINVAMMAALPELAAIKDLFFIHQTGSSDEKEVNAAYASHDLPSRVRAFFNDIGTQYALADLLVCRAGATTVAETALLGKACIFIPYPFAADNHQELNARELVKESAAGMILEKDLSGKKLARLIEYYRTHRQALDYMARQAKAFGHANAAADIVEDCLQVLAHKHFLALFFLWITGWRWHRRTYGV